MHLSQTLHLLPANGIVGDEWCLKREVCGCHAGSRVLKKSSPTQIQYCMALVAVGFSFLFLALLTRRLVTDFVGERSKEAKGMPVLEEAFIGFVLDLTGAELWTISTHG